MAAERAALLGRLATRQDSFDALRGEIEAALADFPDADMVPVEYVGETDEDRARAEYVGETVSRRWEKLALVALATGETLRQAKQTAWRQQLAKFDTIAATETATAFNLEREEALSRFAAANDNSDIIPFLRWDAALDERSCFECEDMDGQIVPASEGWKDDGPGALHPNCRCIDTVVMLPITEWQAA